MSTVVNIGPCECCGCTNPCGGLVDCVIVDGLGLAADTGGCTNCECYAFWKPTLRPAMSGGCCHWEWTSGPAGPGCSPNRINELHLYYDCTSNTMQLVGLKGTASWTTRGECADLDVSDALFIYRLAFDSFNFADAATNTLALYLDNSSCTMPSTVDVRMYATCPSESTCAPCSVFLNHSFWVAIPTVENLADCTTGNDCDIINTFAPAQIFRVEFTGDPDTPPSTCTWHGEMDMGDSVCGGTETIVSVDLDLDDTTDPAGATPTLKLTDSDITPAIAIYTTIRADLQCNGSTTFYRRRDLEPGGTCHNTEHKCLWPDTLTMTPGP